jgi:hypothetical protein
VSKPVGGMAINGRPVGRQDRKRFGIISENRKRNRGLLCVTHYFVAL